MPFRYLPFCVCCLIACTADYDKSIESKATVIRDPITIDVHHAKNLMVMPLNCVMVEYPNKLGQTLGSDDDLKSPSLLHPTFYGCFDWHSAVHGHWSIIKLLKKYPTIEEGARAWDILKTHITPEKIAVEVAYFQQKHNKGYERTYGWAWMLKLSEELHTWQHPEARHLEQTLQPLTDIIVKGYLEYLPKLQYPIRVGTHTNTAFGLSLALDYAITLQQAPLQIAIEERAKAFYISDRDCPITWEPSGHDFLSPCLEEANLMRKILAPQEFSLWLSVFLPQLNDPTYELAPGIVGDRTDGQLVHLDGVNFSRAWCLYGIAGSTPGYGHLTAIGDAHIAHSLNEVVGDDYEGGHWLGSFAIYALDAKEKLLSTIADKNKDNNDDEGE